MIQVSVCMISYNHESFIRDAIEGVLMQKTNFCFELVIGEDCSIDNTRKICESYQIRYPDIIKLLPSDNNLGVMPNFIRTLNACKGEFIAFCEGDDYWTDPYKLQKQVDVLESNMDYSICFHNTEERVIGNSFEPSFLYNSSTQKEISTIYDLAYRNFIPTCSVVYRNNLFDKYPEWFNEISIGDWPLHIMNAQFGKIYYIPHIMGVHRIHSGGVWSSQAQSKSISLIIDVYDKLINWTNDKLLIYHLEIGKANLKKQLLAQTSKEQNNINRIRNVLDIKKIAHLFCPPIVYKLIKKNESF